MEQPFFPLQVSIAFVVGGTIITLLGYLAEKAPRSLRGVIISFPSTLAISFIFLARTLGAETLYSILPALYYSLIGSVLYTLFYAMVAQRFSSVTPESLWPVPLTLVVTTVLWLLVPLSTQYLPQDIPLALVVLLASLFILQSLFSKYARRFPVCSSPPITTIPELFLRAIFAGSVVALSVVFAKTLGPFWGGVVGGAYPASFGSQLMIFQSKYPAKYLPSLIKTVPIGMVSIVAYAYITAVAYPKFGLIIGTLMGFLASLILSYAVGAVTKRVA